MSIDHNRRAIPIVILVDVEPDEFFINRSSSNTWHGCELAFSTLTEARAKLAQATGRPVHFTWLVRADPQIAESYGSPGWVLQQYRQNLEQLRAQGDEIAMHIHAYHWNESLHNWIEDYGDQAWVEHCVRMGVTTYQQVYGHPPKTFSTGADWTNHETIHLLQQLGVECDVSVVAGKSAIPFSTHLGAYTGIRPDSSAIRPQPYHPSAQDFRLPAPNQAETGLWILPLTSYTVGQYQSWRRKLIQLFRSPFAKKAEARIDKLYLESYVKQIQGSVATILRGSEETYLTLIVGSRAFADEKRRKNIHKVLEFLATHQAAAQFTFATPIETLQLLNAQKQSQ